MKIELNGITVNYFEYGIPQGLPLVFIHGFPFCNKIWEPQIKSLPYNVRAISYDIRGHGQSEVADCQYTIDIFVDDLISLLNHLEIEKAVLCGLSMGGYIALRCFERHPERICGLILCDTKSEADTNEVKTKRNASLKNIKQSGIETFTNEFLKQIFFENTYEHNSEVIEFVKNIICSNSTLAICGTILALASRTDTTHVLQSINVPTCIIVGEFDKLIPIETAQFMRQNIHGAELWFIKNAGHMSNLENSQEFNEKLISFIKKNWQIQTS